MAKVRIAIAGVGNCASALLQGISFYGKNGPPQGEVIGLTKYNLGGLTPSDIEIVAAFDVNQDKVGKDLKPIVKISQEPEVPSVAQALRDAGADILVNYLPVGSTNAVQLYAHE